MSAVDPYVISPSRVDELLSCGVRFKLKRVDGHKAEVSGSRLLFGTVLHRALELWSPDRRQDLSSLVERAWVQVADGTTLFDFLAQYQPLSKRARDRIAQILEERPDVKQPRATKDWKQSEEKAAIDVMVALWLPRLGKGSPWLFTENDPLPKLYDESLEVAVRYQEKWQHLPPTFHTEFRFDVPWLSWRLQGIIDTIEPLIDRRTGEVVAIGVGDYKTGAEMSGEMKHWRQLVIYLVAVRSMLAEGQIAVPSSLAGLPIFPFIDYVKLNVRKCWYFDDADLGRLERELGRYSEMVANELYLPADKMSNADFCDIPSLCCQRNCKGAGGGAKPVEVWL